MKTILPAIGAVFASLVPCAAAPITPYHLAIIEYCVGGFIVGQCTVTASSSGSAITSSGTASTSGESITYTASSVSMAGSLGGSVSVTSNTLNSSGPGIMVDAFEQLVDSVTISFAPWNGSTGHMLLLYTLDGTNDATGTNAQATFGGHKIPYACVKLGINDPIFPFGCAAYDQRSVHGTFSAGSFPFIYGQPFPLWFQLESIAGTGFGTGRPTGVGTSATNFYNTATIAGLVLYDPNMKPLSGTPNITSALGISYPILVPEPATSALIGTGALGLLAMWRKKWTSASRPKV